MNPVDLAAIAILVISALFGLSRGFVREVLGLAAWVGAVAGAVACLPLLDPSFRGLAHRLGLEPIVGDAVAGVLLFLLLLLVFSAIANAAARVVRRTPLNGVDRVLGLAFGAARGAALLVVAYVLVALVIPPGQWPDALRRSLATPLAFAGANWAVTVVPAPERPRVLAPDYGAAPGEKV